MSKEELFRNKIYVSSPTSISIGNCTWSALDTKLVGRVEKLIKEKEEAENDVLYILEQIDGYLNKGWTIDLNFSSIREKYGVDKNE